MLFSKSSAILVNVVRNADLAQLAEHVTSNDEVEGSNPLVSTIRTKKALVYLASFFMCVGHDITSSPLKYGSRVFVAKCSEPQAGNGDVMSEGSG